ncbi:hypothetical protein HN51_068843 [Arachis hypogaea]|nr:uncharacterized protein DS421_15g494240 [Arachis hypogaea]QHO10967.1 uncharacterized protein DS421_15g494240 [Arachis hypogaea]QHO10968.1 uncharacterized protein DS421_15g494240 [Arachis hypogaea]
MDYDDNDFQSQNLHLAGEGSTKFPPALRPYALSKFDFDESLQGNLRFDSLVETEVFLGIESNEDNQWIDAFSRGGSGIEFSSTAAESCPISRHGNIWSEATSSESVEMLLKSVGQEEFIPRQTIIQESDACDELACITKQMDPHPKRDDKNEFKDNVTDLQPPGGSHGNLPGLKEDVRMEQPLDGVSKSHEVGPSIGGSSGNLEPSDIHRNIDLPVSDGNPTIYNDNRSNTTILTEVETAADILHSDKTQVDSSVSGVQTHATEASIQSVVDEQQGALQTPINKQDLDGITDMGDAHHPEVSLCSIATTGALEGGSVIEALEKGVNIVEDSLQKEERCTEDDLSRNHAREDVVVLKDELMPDQSALATQELPKVSEEDSTSKGPGGEATNSTCEISPNLKHNVDVVEKTDFGECSVTKENKLLNTGGHMDTEMLSSKPENFVSSEGVNDISKVSEGVLGDSAQICQNSEPDSQTYHEKFDQDASVNDKESKTPSESGPIHSDIDQSHPVDKRGGLSLPCEGIVQTGLTTVAVPINVTPVNNSASQVIVGNVSSTSCEIVPPPSEQVVSSHEATSHNDFQSITVLGPAVDEKEESASKLPEEAGTSAPVESSERDTAPCTISGADKHHSSDASRQVSCETVIDCLHNVEGTSGTVNTAEPQGKVDDKDIQGCNNEDGVPPVLHESTDKLGDGVKFPFSKDDKGNAQNNDAKSSSGDDIVPGNKTSLSSAPSHNSCVELQSFPANNARPPISTVGSPSKTDKDKNQIKVSASQNPPTSQDLKGENASKAESSLTPKLHPAIDSSIKNVMDVNQEDIGKSPPVPVPVIADKKTSTAVDGSPKTSGRRRASKSKISGNISHESPQILDGVAAHSVPKSTPERKPRRTSNKKPVKESSTKGSRVKDTTLGRQSDRGDKSTNVSLSPSPGFQLMQSNEVQQYGHIDPNSSKPFALVNPSTSSLPDLNTSASPPVLFQQPFTDLQQVQLRAQIFVYGALIQGTAPDEPYMISAFGGPDGGRSIWEKAWRACMERQHGQKSHPVNPETPLQSKSGARTADSAVKQSTAPGKGISSPLGRGSSKATPTTVNPLVPFSSPLWNLPTPSCDSVQPNALGRGSVVDYSQALPSLHPYQTPPLRNFLGHNTSWISQASIRGPYIPSGSPAPDNSAHVSASPFSDTIKLSSAKGPSLPPTSVIKNGTPGLPELSTSIPSTTIGSVSALDANNVTVSLPQQSSDPKPRKRKKITVSEDFGQKTLQSPPPVVTTYVSTSVAVATPVVTLPITTSEKSVVSVPPLAERLKIDQNVEKRILSDESLMKVKEAKLHAEEASALSAAAVNHSLEIWTQLDKHKNSGLMPDIEAKLASAAVAVAAAAAVAKAAAAAANVASNAAVQAKLMADEALISCASDNSSQFNKISLSEGTSNFGQASPASILKGANGTNSPGSIIVAAKEAARRRVEAASAASKRAENMDAIVKAAELAAEAVSQAGKIVTMGDPLPLSDLVDAGPEGYWKSAGESSQHVGLSKDMTRDLVSIDNVGDIPETSNTHNRDISLVGISSSINEKNSRGPRGRKVTELTKPVDVVPESEPQIQISNTVSDENETVEGNNFKEGSLIEVFKDEEGYKAAWFTANILSLKDGKAYVGYTSLVAVEGAGPLKEWVSLEAEGDKPPRIRAARPLTSLHYEGTRKRRRAALGDYAWSVGDKVDAWVQESWWEGVITEKNKKDEKTFTVHFPASGETTVVRAWHLRPSLIWKEGKWIESSKVVATISSTHEGDTPNEKRPKLSNPADVNGQDNMSKSIDATESSNSDGLRLLNLTENEKVFNIGNSSKNENKLDTHRTARTGLQKEGSKVIFGVPKPGKKRKFMEVSKHYVAQESKISDKNDSVKLANFLMPPQSSGPRGWKNSSKNDTRERLGADSKPKTSRSGRPHSAFGRAIPPKDNPSSASSLSSDLPGHTERIKDSTHFKNASHGENQLEKAPYTTDGATQGPILFSSLATSTDAVPAKKTSTSRASKGKLAPAGGKLGKGETEKPSNDPIKSTSDAIEQPRRSNRRIQPTSRLLEGLQSSLIISKIPSVSHNRNASKGNN